MDVNVGRMLATDETVRLIAKPGDWKSQRTAEGGCRADIAVYHAIRRAPRIVHDTVQLHQVIIRLLDVARKDHLDAALSVRERLDHLVGPAHHRVLATRTLHVRVPTLVVLQEDDVLVDDRRIDHVHFLFPLFVLFRPFRGLRATVYYDK